MSPASTDDTSRQKVYRAVRRCIIMGQYGPGARLDVGELAEHYQVSASPVREALQMLNHEGLVSTKPRSGYFVTHTTLKQLRDILELREVLEIAAVERAADRVTEAQLAELEHVHAGYTGDDDESYDRYTDENRRFHYLLALASGNAELAEALARVHDRLARFMVLRHAGQTQPASHARIVDALRHRDVAAARQALLAEVTETRTAILDRLVLEQGAYWQLGAHVAG